VVFLTLSFAGMIASRRWRSCDAMTTFSRHSRGSRATRWAHSVATRFGAGADVITQTRQINVMLKVRERLTGTAEVPPPPDDPKMEMDMGRIRMLSGEALDHFYLMELIPHHAPAIEIAHRSLPTLETRAIRKVARETFEGQAREIAEIQVLRGKFSCDSEK
jgi:uncharacterized protein (DUF305 family)